MTSERRKSNNIKGHTDVPYFKDDNLIVSLALQKKKGHDIYSLRPRRTAVEQ